MIVEIEVRRFLWTETFSGVQSYFKGALPAAASAARDFLATRRDNWAALTVRWAHFATTQVSSIVDHESMKISVVTVCRNSERTIAATIESFLDQDYEDKELLILDGNSSDLTADIVKSFKNSEIRFVSEPDAGIYDAMNKGLRMFSGDAIGFLNSDDTFSDNQTLRKIGASLSRCDAVHGDLRMVSDHLEKRVIRRWKSSPFRPGAFRHGWMPPHPTFYITRSLASAVGGFNLEYSISADYDFMLRALEICKASSSYVPTTLVDFMAGGRSTKNFASVVEGNLQCLRSRRKHLNVSIIDFALFTKPLKKLAQIPR